VSGEYANGQSRRRKGLVGTSRRTVLEVLTGIHARWRRYINPHYHAKDIARWLAP